jgi:hypothetical protein
MNGDLDEKSIEKLGGYIDRNTKKAYIPSGSRSKELFGAMKKHKYLLGNVVDEDAFVKQLAYGYELTPDNIKSQLETVLSNEASTQRKTRWANQAHSSLKEGIDVSMSNKDKLYATSFDSYVTNKIKSVLEFNEKHMVDAMDKLGVNNKDFQEQIAKRSMDALGLNELQQNDVIQAFKTKQAMSRQPALGVKALTGEIYNVSHNKIWTAAFDTFEHRSDKGREAIGRIMQWAGVGQQLNISSKHYFPPVAPDIIRTVRDFATGDDPLRRAALRKLESGNFNIEVSHAMQKQIIETSKLVSKSKREGSTFLKDLVRRFQSDPVGGKVMNKEGSMQLTEFKRFWNIRKEYLPEGEQKRLAQIMVDQVDDTMADAKMSAGTVDIIKKMEGNLAKRFSNKSVYDFMMAQSYNVDATLSDARHALNDLVGNTDSRFTQMLKSTFFPKARVYDSIPKSIQRTMREKTGGEILFGRMHKRLNDLMDNVVERRGNKNTQSMANQIKKAGKGGLGLILGAAAAGYLAYQAYQPPAETWLGKTAGTGGEYYDRNISKSDEHATERSQLKHAMKSLGSWGEWPMPDSYKTKTARIQTPNNLKRTPNLQEVLSGQHRESFAPRYRKVGARRISSDETLLGRVSRIINR